MHLKNFQQQVGKWVKVYYKCLLKVANSVQVKANNVILNIIFKASLQPYLILATIGMTKDTMIKHKEAIVICEENEPSIANYNALIIQPESKPIAQPIVTYTTAKQ
jgi:hypothetical protein